MSKGETLVQIREAKCMEYLAVKKQVEAKRTGEHKKHKKEVASAVRQSNASKLRQ